MSEQSPIMALQEQIGNSDIDEAARWGGVYNDRITSAETNQYQQPNASGRAAPVSSNKRNQGHKEVAKRLLHKPRKQISKRSDRISKDKPTHQRQLSTVALANQRSARKVDSQPMNFEEPRPQEMPPNMIGYGAVWPTSGKLAGQPGYGYSADGVPLGAIHFKSSSRLSPIHGKDVSSTLPSMGEPSRAIREIERAGWGRKEDIARELIRISDDGQLNVVNAQKVIQKCESTALRRVLKYNSELEL